MLKIRSKKKYRCTNPLLFDAHKYSRLSPESAVEKFKGVVIKWASHYYSKFTGLLEKEDLISAGNIGVIKAVRNYTPENSRFRLSSFRTYTENYIKWEIKNEISSYVEGVKEKVCVKINKRKNADKVIKNIPIFLSLDSPVSDADKNSVLHDVIEDANASDSIFKKALLSEIWQKAKKLPKTQYHVLDLRYKNGKTLSEVGGLLGISRERVRQIEEDAVTKLKRLLKEVN